MSEANRPRRVLAELKWGGDPSAIMWVGNRTIHQYWPLLSGYFRDILLPPQRRADENAVSWTWREPADGKPIGAAELAGVRKRLTADHQLFAENLTRGEASGLRGQGNIDELGTAIEGAIAQLVSSGDDELASFVCRTEQGLRVHSWGARTAAPRTFPDTREREISGRVVVRGKGASRYAVALETSAGATVAQTTTDASGAFRFPNVAPGDYRLKARGRKSGTWFPENGCLAALARESISGLVLCDDDVEPIAVLGRRRPWLWRWGWGAVGAAVLLGGGGWVWHRTAAARETARAKERSSELNSSHAVASEKQRGARASQAGEENAVEAPRRVAVAAGDGRESRWQAGRTSPGAMTVSEKSVLVPASPSLPGEISGLPGKSAEAIANPVGRGGAAAGEAGTSLKADGRSDRVAEAEVRAGGPRSREETEKAPETMGETTEEESKGLPKSDPSRAEPLATISEEEPAKSDGAGAVVERGGFVEKEAKATWFGTHREWRVRQMPWRAHPWRDLILPTAPVPAGEPEGLDALRERMLAELDARMPATFRTGRVRGGVVFTTGDPEETLTWLNDDGRGRSGRGSAEIECDAMAERETSAQLVRADGRIVAEMRCAASELVLRVAEGVEAWRWLESADSGAAERFSWRSGSDAPLPEAWVNANRVSVPLTAATAGVARSLALVDAATGWALVGELRIEASGELTR